MRLNALLEEPDGVQGMTIRSKHPWGQWLTACGCALLLSNPTLAADAANGEKLYNGGCFKCHDTTIHTRPDKIIFSKKALIKRVEFCEGNAGMNWNKSQIEDVAEYLNKTFYKYEN